MLYHEWKWDSGWRRQVSVKTKSSLSLKPSCVFAIVCIPGEPHYWFGDQSTIFCGRSQNQCLIQNIDYIYRIDTLCFWSVTRRCALWLKKKQLLKIQWQSESITPCTERPVRKVFQNFRATCKKTATNNGFNSDFLQTSAQTKSVNVTTQIQNMLTVSSVCKDLHFCVLCWEKKHLKPRLTLTTNLLKIMSVSRAAFFFWPLWLDSC
jgi:hypothetical protein